MTSRIHPSHCVSSTKTVTRAKLVCRYCSHILKYGTTHTVAGIEPCENNVNKLTINMPRRTT